MTGCGDDAQTAPAHEPALREDAPPEPFATRFEIAVGGQMVRMQVALEPQEQQRGLMFREKLRPNEGMIFVFDRPRRLSFWMKNTPLPLDIGYFDAEGVLREIYPLRPFDETSVISRRADLQLALEMERGWYAANGVAPGAALDLPGLIRAIEARGVDPAVFRLNAPEATP